MYQNIFDDDKKKLFPLCRQTSSIEGRLGNRKNLSINHSNVFTFAFSLSVEAKVLLSIDK